MKLENRQIGVFTAVILAVIMLFLPDPGKSRYGFDPELLSSMIAKSEDQISPEQLSEMIIQGKNDFQLIDIRTPEEFQKGTIKNAENIPLNELLKEKTIRQNLSSDKLIIIFSNGNSHAHQAWVVLKTAGKNSYVLSGGYNQWNKAVLNPAMPLDESDDEILRYEKAKAVAESFGGSSSQGGMEIKNPGKTGFKSKIKISDKKKIRGC